MKAFKSNGAAVNLIEDEDIRPVGGRPGGGGTH